MDGFLMNYQLPSKPSKNQRSKSRRTKIQRPKTQRNMQSSKKQPRIQTSKSQTSKNQPSESEKEYPVDKIVGKKIEAGKILYEVVWWGHDEHTWESIDFLENCQEAVEEFEKSFVQFFFCFFGVFFCMFLDKKSFPTKKKKKKNQAHDIGYTFFGESSNRNEDIETIWVDPIQIKDPYVNSTPSQMPGLE